MQEERPAERPVERTDQQPIERPAERLGNSEEWTLRCAQRIVEVDPDIGADEASRIAADMVLVERLSAMAPDAAVDFVRHQLAAEQPDKYERRSRAR